MGVGGCASCLPPPAVHPEQGGGVLGRWEVIKLVYTHF